MIDFPNSPSAGQVFNPGNGTSYKWDGTKWNLSPRAVPLDLGGLPLTGVPSINGSPMGLFRNKIINGDFIQWQRNTSQASSGYGSDDRWINLNVGSTKVHSLQNFAVGQTDVPGAPAYFSRTVVTSVAGAGNLVEKQQYIEDVTLLAGKTVTVTFYAKADSAKNMAVDMTQFFGTGGSPSPLIESISPRSLALTAAWKKFSFTVTLPSIVGKTLGSNGNSATGLRLWFDAGATYAVPAAGLGQQSGTFDIAHVSIVEGDATVEDDPFSARPYSIEEILCYRYYRRVMMRQGAYYNAAGAYFGKIDNLVPTLRGPPSVTYTDLAGTPSRFTVSGTNGLAITGGGISATYNQAIVDGISPVAINNTWWGLFILIDAEII